MTIQKRPAGLALCVLGLVCVQARAQSGEALKISVEWRGRADFNRDAAQSLNERLFLNRLRFRIAAQPAPLVRFVVEAQDSGAFSLGNQSDARPYRNHVDLHQAYFEAGNAEAGWQLRAGRQALSSGDERLVGADSEWDQFGPVFDAVRVAHVAPRRTLAAFSGFLVSQGARRPDPISTGDRLSGLTLELKPSAEREDTFTPYLLWKRNHASFDLLGREGHRDIVAPGVHAQGALPASLAYNVEMAFQFGHVAQSRVAAWAGHWQLDAPLMDRPEGPTISAEFNYASGDRASGDGVHGTFDDMYPAGYNGLGLVDPFAWRNIRYPAVSATVPVTPRLSIQSAFRAYFLATVEDGLYPGGDEPLVVNPAATSSHIGNQVLVAATFTATRRARFSAGYGRLMPGAYLHQSGAVSRLNSFYLLSVVSF